MYLNYSKLEFDRDGNPETPELVLTTLSDKVIGVIPGAHNLKLHIKYSEPSEISFDVPAKINGEDNPLYEAVSGHKQVYTKCYGIYEILNPSIEADGISEVKHIKGYSCEKTLESKKFFLEEGTFNFWNPASPTNTVLGRILEIAVGWSVGYVSPSLIGRYRTFDDYDDYLLSFVYNSAPEKYRCVFVFDTYGKTINVYDADEEITNLPIYLDFENLLKSMDIEEQSDELVTAIRPYGADDLDIRAVNPIGTNWLYDLSYFMHNGDISGALASKWNTWQRSVINNQMYYKGLVALQASATSRILAEQAALADLNGELDSLTGQQSVTIQALAMETTSAGISSQQAVLNNINTKIAAKKSEISAKNSLIGTIQSELDSYTAEIKAVVDRLSIKNYFTPSEYAELSHFMIEQDITENTFVASTVDASISGNTYKLSNEVVSISNSSISMVDLTSTFSKKMYVMSGGTFALSGGYSVSGDIIRGTLETRSNGNFVMSFYAGTTRVGNTTAASGNITIIGTYSGLSSNIRAVTVDEVTTNEGTTLRLTARTGSMFLTGNVSEYQKYSVQMELYDYAVGVLSDLATPTYEFSVESGNFLFNQEFAPFRNQLELGKGVYLKVGDSTITPYIIEFELSFEDRSQFSIVFSNRFKRHDNVNTLKDMIETSYSTSRNFDASKYIYNQASSQASAVSKFMSDSLDAAKNMILGASNQSVIISGSGIGVSSPSNPRLQLRIVNGMIAMTDDNWEHAKVGIGLFSSPEVGEYFGVNAEVIGGKLIIGNNLIIENENDTGVMQFKVDSTGAWLNNSTFVLQKDNGGKIIIDPKYGIMGGSNLLFDTNGTTVIPGFIDRSGNIIFDSDGMPQNSNFFLDINDGSAYFRGKLLAKSGKIGGYTIENSYLHSGSGGNYVALNGGTSVHSAYAIWAGASNPANAPFYVKKDGTLYAKKGKFAGELEAATGTFSGALRAATGTFSGSLSAVNGTFTGTLSAANISGNLTANSGAALVGCAIYVPNKTNPKFSVDSAGNVNMTGNLVLSNGSISWSHLAGGVQNRITNVESDVSALSSDLSWTQRNIDNRLYNFNTRMDGVENDITWLSNNTWTEREIKSIASTQITNELVASPRIYGAYIQGGTINGAHFMFGNFGSIYDGYGSDGVRRTDLACIESNRGMSLSASEGMAINAGNGIWINSEVHIRVNGRFVNLNDALASL